MNSSEITCCSSVRVDLISVNMKLLLHVYTYSMKIILVQSPVVHIINKVSLYMYIDAHRIIIDHAISIIMKLQSAYTNNENNIPPGISMQCIYNNIQCTVIIIIIILYYTIIIVVVTKVTSLATSTMLVPLLRQLPQLPDIPATPIVTRVPPSPSLPPSLPLSLSLFQLSPLSLPPSRCKDRAFQCWEEFSRCSKS